MSPSGRAWDPRHTVLALAVLSMFVTMGARVVVSPLVPAVIDTFGATKATVGLALSGMWAAFALAHLPSGVLGDRFGEEYVMTAAVGLTGLGCLLLATAPTFLLFGVAAGLLGAGAGLYLPTATSLLTRRFEDRGQALGIHMVGGPVGGLVAPVAAAAVAARYGWRAGVMVGAAIALPVFALLAWRLRPSPDDVPVQADGLTPSLGTMHDLLSRPSVAYTTLVAAVAMFSWQAFVSFFPTFLVEEHGLGTATASAVFGVLFVVSAASLPVAGRLSDAFDRDLVLAASLLASAAGFALFVTTRGTVALGASVLVLGVGLSWGGVLQSRYMDILPPDERGTGFGMARAVYVLLGASGSVVTGTVAETVGWGSAYGLVAALLVAGGFALVGNRVLGVGL